MKARIIINEIKKGADTLDGISIGRHNVMKAYSHAVEAYPRQFTDINNHYCMFSNFDENIANPWEVRNLHLAARILECDVKNLLWLGLTNIMMRDMPNDLYDRLSSCKNDMRQWLRPQFLESECVTIPVSEERNPDFTNEYYALIVNTDIRAVKALNQWERTDNHVKFASSNYYVQYR